MSADAKAWPKTEGSGWVWEGIHDGSCKYHLTDNKHHGTLSEVLTEISRCLESEDCMSWEIREYPDGKTGLVGYTS